ncbi:MAG: SLC13 family permease, partial [Verrucomicrobiota bacterium]
MAIWWISDAIPMAATALVPLVLFPLTGIMSGKDLAPVYTNYIIFLFIGGFMIALAMERWNLHRRIALFIVKAVGGSPALMVLGFMFATAFLSMWISNTATTIMMVAIGLAVIKSTESTCGKENTGKFSVALLLGIAYSASVGGMATLVGTPPNLALSRIFEMTFPDAEAAGVALSFGQWMLFGVPVALIMLCIVWLVLTKVFYRPDKSLKITREIIAEEQEKLGKITYEEVIVLSVFILTALGWVFRKDLIIGDFTLPGWSGLVPFGKFIDDGTVAIAMALLLFIIPAKRKDESEGYGSILDFGVFSKLPWHIVLLLSGGFALAKGVQTSGLSTWIGGNFSGLSDAPVVVLVMGICGILTFLTELTSNTATTEMILPILASIAVEINLNPLLLMIPATISASCAFMMPVATAPNAIVFGSGRIKIIQMVKAGIVLNLIGLIVITVMFLLLGPLVFDIDTKAFPDWAKTIHTEG